MRINKLHIKSMFQHVTYTLLIASIITIMINFFDFLNKFNHLRHGFDSSLLVKYLSQDFLINISLILPFAFLLATLIQAKIKQNEWLATQSLGLKASRYKVLLICIAIMWCVILSLQFNFINPILEQHNYNIERKLFKNAYKHLNKSEQKQLWFKYKNVLYYLPEYDMKATKFNHVHIYNNQSMPNDEIKAKSTLTSEIIELSALNYDAQYKTWYGVDAYEHRLGYKPTTKASIPVALSPLTFRDIVEQIRFPSHFNTLDLIDVMQRWIHADHVYAPLFAQLKTRILYPWLLFGFLILFLPWYGTLWHNPKSINQLLGLGMALISIELLIYKCSLMLGRLDTQCIVFISLTLLLMFAIGYYDKNIRKVV